LFGQKSGQVTKFLPPSVETIIGTHTDSNKVSTSEASQLIALPLKIRDKNNRAYSIETYQFLYKRKGFIQNPETGKVETIFTTVAQRFDTTPLPKVWIDNIKEDLKSDEEFYFFDIIIKDQSGRRFFAPSLKIFIQ